MQATTNVYVVFIGLSSFEIDRWDDRIFIPRIMKKKLRFLTAPIRASIKRATSAPSAKGLVVNAEVRNDQIAGRNLCIHHKAKTPGADIPGVSTFLPVDQRTWIILQVPIPDLIPN